MATIVTRSGKGSPLTHAEVDANFTNLNTDKLELSGGTMTGNLEVQGTVTADGLTVDPANSASIKIQSNTTTSPVATLELIRGTNATFGADAYGDYRIKNEGSQLYIDNGSNGSTYTRFNINTDGDISFYEDTGTTAKFFWDASAERLGIGNAAPATTLDVTGTVTADGLTVDGTGVEVISVNSTQNGAQINFDSASTSVDWSIGVSNNADGDFLIYQSGSGSGDINLYTGGLKRQEINRNGDISFYEDTGTTPKFFWDASLEELIVGSSTGAGGAGLTITSSSGDAIGYLVARGNNSLTTQHRYLNKSSGGSNTGGAVGHIGDTGLILTASSTSIDGAQDVVIDSSGNVGIGTSSPDTKLTVSGGDIKATGSLRNQMLVIERTDAANDYEWQIQGGSSSDLPYLSFVDNKGGAAAERMRIDSSGNLLVGTTDTTLYNNSDGSEGVRIAEDHVSIASNARTVFYVNRQTSDGEIINIRKDGTTVGSIGVSSTTGLEYMYIGSGAVGLLFDEYGTDGIRPFNTNGTLRDNAIDLGSSTARFDDVYATNGTIQTSDQNEKQDIAELTDAEQRVAVAAKGLLRKFRWKDAVAEKGDEARTHFGIIAQDLQAAFAAEGLDAGDYAMFIHSTWTDEETGEEKSRMGVRYSELLAFIIAAI
jgi:hypothetical protein